MTPMNARLTQFGIIAFSAILMVAVGLFAFQSLNQIAQTDLLGSEENAEEGSLPYESRIKKGDAYFEGGFYEEAASEYAYAVQIEPNSVQGHLKLSRAYLGAHQYDKAELNAKTAYELEEPSASTVALYAQTLLSTGKANDAKNLLDTFENPTQEVLYVRGLTALAQGEEAKAYFEQAITQSGSISPAEIQNFLTAYEIAGAAQGSDSHYLNALLAKALLDNGELVLAEQLALQTLKVKSDYRDVWMILGYTQLELGKLPEAEDSFRAAKKIDSVKPEVHFLLGNTHFLQKEYEDCIDEMELALLYNFEPASEAYKKMAESHNALGQYEEALAAYEAMVNVDPSSVGLFEAPVDLALNKVQNLDRAETLAQKAVDLFPGDALGHTLLAQVYLKKGTTDLALQSVQKAFSADSEYAEAHLVAGQIREAENNLEGAKWEYKKAFELSTSGDSVNTAAAENYNRLMTTPTE